MTNEYRVATFEGDSPRNLDDNINALLANDSNIIPINISLSTYLSMGSVKYVAVLLHTFKP